MDRIYFELDNEVKDGVFAVHSDDDIDMLALRNYCMNNNIAYKDLTENEIAKFRKSVSLAY
jgi:hypothetical protein